MNFAAKQASKAEPNDVLEHGMYLGILKKNNNPGGFTLPDFTINHKVKVAPAVWSLLRIHMEISGIELRVQKSTLTFMVN